MSNNEITSIEDIIDVSEENFVDSNFSNGLFVYAGVIKCFPTLDVNLDIDNIMCLKYATHSSFEKHSHVKITDSHLYDLIIFPPISLLPIPFKGGDLIIHHNDKKEIIKVDNLNEWKIVKLDLGIPHEVTEITKGIRYSFKYEVYK